MRFGDFSKNISKPLDRKAKYSGTPESFLKAKAMKFVYLI